MEIGMLWYDNDPHLDLGDKVKNAAAYYQRKYRQTPNLCFVNPCMILDVRTQAGAITVCSNKAIQPHHFWIGFAMQDQPEVEQKCEVSG
jgi:hypothetical protein